MKNDIPYDLLEPYLQGSMNEIERSDFEKRLNADPEFQEQLDLYKMIREANQDEGLADFEKKLQIAQENHEGKSGKKVSIARHWIWIGVAAAVINLLFAFVLVNKYWNSTPEDIEGIYNKYAQHDFSFQEKSADPKLANLEKLLKSGQYAEVLPSIERFLEDSPEQVDVQLAKGIALMETGKIDEAIEVFTKLGTEHPLYHNESLWYTALAYLKQRQIEKSRARLMQIPKEASRFSESQALIHNLGKIRE